MSERSSFHPCAAHDRGAPIHPDTKSAVVAASIHRMIREYRGRFIEPQAFFVRRHARLPVHSA
jgi:hypothetical protein